MTTKAVPSDLRMREVSMPEYTIYLRGLARVDHGLPGRVMRDLVDTVDQGSRGAVRLRLEGRSSAPGSAPAWLEQASAFDVVDFASDTAGVVLRAPTLRESLPDRFGQTELFPTVDPDKSAIGLLADSLADAVAGREDSDAYDESLLTTFGALRAVFQRGVEAIDICNSKRHARVRVAPGGIDTIERLHRSTPLSRRVRLAGRVDAIRYSDRAFTLVLDRGRTVRGVLADGSPETLAGLFGRTAIVSGVLHYRPSGAVQRLDADRLEPAAPEDLQAWSLLPAPLDIERDRREGHKPQGPRTGASAIFGTWPGDESDEEVLRILEEIS